MRVRDDDDGDLFENEWTRKRVHQSKVNTLYVAGCQALPAE